jgi:hypothetical protein
MPSVFAVLRLTISIRTRPSRRLSEINQAHQLGFLTGTREAASLRLCRSRNTHVQNARISRRQNRDARIVQRAYVRVGPGGIRTNSGGEYVGHVLIENVGQLPATKFTWRFETIHVADGDWQTPLLKKFKFRYDNVLPIRMEIVRGSNGISRDPLTPARRNRNFSMSGAGLNTMTDLA